MIYGYCRVSTAQQNIERQERNILAEYPTASIIKETYSGRKIEGRKEFEKLLNIIKADDTIIFDSVSRMSRNAEEGYQLYRDLFEKGVNLVFIKEKHINTDTYKQAINQSVQMTGSLVDSILRGINEYLLELAREQIKIAFMQSEKEVEDLRQRTKEGLVTAKLNGKRVGGEKGRTLTTKKSIEAKGQILKYSKDFRGSLKDTEVMKLIGISRNSYYKYKKEIVAEGQVN